MKRFALLAAFSTFSLLAQDLPQLSPKAVVEQRIGLTDTKLTYWRPSARGRDVFNEVVTSGQHWRLGANSNTLLTTSTDLEFRNGIVPAGTYSLSLFANDGEWTLVVNRDTEGWGVSSYDEKKDVLRVTVPVEMGQMRSETMVLFWDNIQKSSADLVISWGDRSARFAVSVPTERLAKENLDKALADPKAEWTVYRNAARYGWENKLPQAEEWARKAVSMKADNWYNHYLLAQILESNGKKAEALKSAQRALEVGLADAKKASKPFSSEADVQALIRRLK
ncbi:MAG: hypothetical protein RL276_1607 [Bacteroidota bacterium]|jgi:ribosomal protein L7/L12